VNHLVHYISGNIRSNISPEKLPEKNWRVHWLAGAIAHRKAQLDPSYAPTAKEITSRTGEVLTLAWGPDHEGTKRFLSSIRLPERENPAVTLNQRPSRPRMTSVCLVTMRECDRIRFRFKGWSATSCS
jgi:hypothetical protein